MKKGQEQKAETKKPAVQLNKISDKRQSISAIDVEDKIELERREAFVEPETRDLLRTLLREGEEKEIIPVYTPSIGFVYQVRSSKSSNNGTDQISKDCLENLVHLDLIQKSFFDSVSSCPNCKSTIMTLHNRCPKCKSHNVNKTSLTEHIPCGYIDQRDKYINDRCPKCGNPLIDGQYRNMGRWYICQECSEKFENPEFDLVCRVCKKNFAIKEALATDIPKYSLNLNRLKEIRQNVASLEDIRLLLTDLGFNIEIPGLIVGEKSGMQHHFSLMAKKQITSGQEIVIALDHVVSELEVQTSPLILYLYKTSEIKVDIPIFVAIPQLSETAKKIAQGHDILLIEGSTQQAQATSRIKNAINERMVKIDQKIVDESKNQQLEIKPETKSFFGKLRGVKKT
jgi:ssDNA-binding Zn-finger/Zn-ribbon topoisomerase 1